MLMPEHGSLMSMDGLALDRYPPDMRQATHDAIAAVLAMAPLPPGATGSAIVPGQEPLPPGAPHLIALCGLPRSGKDTAAGYLEGRYAGVARIAFSTPILAEVNAFLAPHGHFITEQNKSDAHYRRLLQMWGAGRRVEDPHWWTRRLSEEIDHRRAHGTALVVLSGARDPGDFHFVRSRGGLVWRVTRPGYHPAAIDHPLEQYVATLTSADLDADLINAEGDLSAYLAAIDHAVHAAASA